jgi:hypothetical protein
MDSGLPNRRQIILRFFKIKTVRSGGSGGQDRHLRHRLVSCEQVLPKLKPFAVIVREPRRRSARRMTRNPFDRCADVVFR